MSMIIHMETRIDEIIKKERGRRGWDQANLAQRLGVRQQTVSRWESGTSRPQRPKIAVIAKLLDLDATELLRAAGYPSELAESPSQVNPPVRPFVSTLPLSQLAPDRFEEFCRDFVSLLRPGAEVARFGGQGHTQDGIDLIARDGDVVETFQCKRHQRFGPAKVKAAVEAVQIDAKRHHLMLSRAPASPEARKEILKYADWTLWDAEDISRAIRLDLLQDDAVRLVDTYFPGWPKQFLGISEPGPWLKTNDFFQRDLNKGHLYSHAWDLVGREMELGEIVDFATSDQGPGIALLTGRGGVGKSRLLREVAASVEHNGRMKVRFVARHPAITADHLKQLPTGRLLIVIDDAHDEPELANLLTSILQERPAARIVLSARPYARMLIDHALRSISVHAQERPHWELSDLEIEEAERLAQAILGDRFLPSVAQRLALVTADCPLITVVGAGLISRGELAPTQLEANDAIRHEILLHFRDALVAEPVGDPELRSSVINAIAILQPVRLNDDVFQSALRHLTDAPLDRVAQELNRLEEGGVLLRRGNSLRIVPDLLGDTILTDVCLTAGSTTPTGYVERALLAAGGTAAQHILINISRLDWQVRQGSQPAGDLLDRAWALLEAEFLASGLYGRSQLLDLIGRIAYYQPGRALGLVQLAIAHPTDSVEEMDEPLLRLYPPSVESVTRKLPEILHDIAYDLEYLPKVLDILWELAQQDPRPTNQYPEHPVRVLQDLARYEPGKPLDYNEIVLNVARRWLDSIDGSELYSPFDILEALLATEGEEHWSRGFTISWRRFPLNLEAIASLRQRVIELALRDITSSNLKRALRAVKAIGSSVRYPYSEVTASDRQRWTEELVKTIEELGSLIKKRSFDPVVTIAIRDELVWHEHYSTTATREAAQDVAAAIEEDLHYNLVLALHDGWGRLRERPGQDYRQAALDLDAWRHETAVQLFESMTLDELVEQLEERLRILQEVDDLSRANSGPFIWALVSEQPDTGLRICQRLVMMPESPLRSILPVVLGSLMNSRPIEAFVNAHDLIATHECFVPDVARAIGWNRGLRPEIIEGELELLYRFATDSSSSVRISATNAARSIADSDKATAIALALAIPLADDSKVASEVLQLFGSHGFADWSELSDSDIDRILRDIEVLPDLEEYPTQDALSSLSYTKPESVLHLLMNRIERMETNHGSTRYEALPFSWYKPLGFRSQDDFPSILREVRDWIGEQQDSWPRRRVGAELFRLVADQLFDEQILDVLNEVLIDGSEEQIRTVGIILSKAPRTLLLENVEFVTRVLRAAERHGEECVRSVGGTLHSRVTTGTRQGTPGEPFPEDVMQRELAAEARSRLPKGSIEERFYRSLEQAAIESIRSQQERDADLLERRSW